MSEKKSKEKPEELIQAQQLIDEGKADEALQIMNNFEKKEGQTLYNIVSCHLLKCELLYQQGLFEDLVKFAEQTYKESLGLGKNLFSIDVLMWIASALIWLDELDGMFDIIKQAEELLNSLTQKSPTEYKLREASLLYFKGLFYSEKHENDRALEHLMRSLSIREEIDAKPEIANALISIAIILVHQKNELNRALKYIERGLALAEKSNKKYLIALSLLWMAGLFSLKGELDRSIKLNKSSLEIFTYLNHKWWMAYCFNNFGEIYRLKGDLDSALECLEHGLVLFSELGKLKHIAYIHDYLIQVLIEKGDLERAQQYLHDMERMSIELKDKEFDLLCLFNKALLLKTSSRARNRVEAENIFKKLLENDYPDFEFTIKILLNLCELFMIELRITNDAEVLHELKLYISELLEIAEKSQSYWILCETHLLQAKLSLLTFDIKKAKRFLTQAQQIAERFGFNQLATNIANENESLLTKLDLWEKLKEINAPMEDRFELARLDEQIIGMIQKSAVLTTQVTEEKISIHREKKICLVCRGEVLRFSYICKCGAMYCDNCARALTNLENACWVCEVPIDYTKPVKIFREDTKVTIEEKAKKK